MARVGQKREKNDDILPLGFESKLFFFENGRVHTFMSFSSSSFTALGNFLFLSLLANGCFAGKGRFFRL